MTSTISSFDNINNNNNDIPSLNTSKRSKTNTVNSLETNKESSLMTKISDTIASLVPGSQTNTKTKTAKPDNSIYNDVITESRSSRQSPSKLQSNLNRASPADSDSPSTDRGFLSGLMDLFKNTYFKIVLLILILAFLGFNLFKYLANATDQTTDLFGDPIKQMFALFGYTVGETTKNIVDTSAEGTKLGVDVAADATEDAIDLGQRALGAKSSKPTTSNSSTTSKPSSNKSLDFKKSSICK